MRRWTSVVVMTDTAPALFDRLADRYDQVIPFFAAFAEQLLDVLGPDPGTRLLDIGSGRGAIAAAAAARGPRPGGRSGVPAACAGRTDPDARIGRHRARPRRRGLPRRRPSQRPPPHPAATADRRHLTIAEGGGVAAPGDVYGQSVRCLDIAEQALQEAGASVADVVRTRVTPTDIEQWRDAARAHAQRSAQVRPACTFAEVSRFIDPQWLVEFELDTIILE